MHIDPVNRSLQISVGELSRFQNTSYESFDGTQPWRAELGRKWHEKIQADTGEKFPNSKFEVSIKETLYYKNWTFQIQGRIDQIIDNGNGTLEINEIKTVRYPIPEDSRILKEKYAHYFTQCAIYFHLLKQNSDYADIPFIASLTFIDIETGLAQTIEIDNDDKATVHQQLDALLPFLNDRSNALTRLQSIQTKAPFSELREGQSDLIQALEKATLQCPHILVQAPTGFGKTGIVLHHAINHMKSGFFERLIYLTAKSTGQLQTLKQLNTLGALRYVQMRNREELRIDSSNHRCTGDTQCDVQFSLRLKQIGLGPENVFKGNTFTIEAIKSIGAELGLCPYALSKWSLPYAEIWVGDSNYVFNPSSRNVFFDTHGFNPKKTLLIIDEAHNLPSRTADALSIQLSAHSWEALQESTLENYASNCLKAIGRDILKFLKTLKSKSILNSTQTYTLQDLLEDFSQELSENPVYHNDIPQKDLSLIYSIIKARDILTHQTENFIIWSPQEQTLKLNCLDPSEWIADCLEPFASTIQMSATLDPIDNHLKLIGLSNLESTIAIGHAPWRSKAYSVAIDVRVDTRYKSRSHYYETTAQTIATLYNETSNQAVAIFFPSYHYAETIKTYIETIDYSLPICLQEKNLSLQEQKDFIENSIENRAILFLVLGSAFAEGIDTLGGQIETAMVISPALPEVNPLNQMKLQYEKQSDPSTAFQKTYIIPAFQKIHQALGRLVRAPGHSAKILLHGKRFLQPEYREILADEYQTETVIRKYSELSDWLQT